MFAIPVSEKKNRLVSKHFAYMVSGNSTHIILCETFVLFVTDCLWVKLKPNNNVSYLNAELGCFLFLIRKSFLNK